MSLKVENAQGALMFKLQDGTIHDWRKHKIAYVEHPQDVGLRFVGYADEIASRAVEHFGWYLNEDFADEAYRGCVFQLPSRNGLPIFVPGYQRVSTGRTHSPAEDGYLVALRQVDREIGEKDDNQEYGYGRAVVSCAIAADDIARYDAEEECAYQKSWQLGNQYSDYVAEYKELRQQRRLLIASLKAAREDIATLGLTRPWVAEICAKLRADITSLKNASRNAYDKAQGILRDNSYTNRQAFNEAAGMDVL